jgi:hypothetical protein
MCNNISAEFQSFASKTHLIIQQEKRRDGNGVYGHAKIIISRRKTQQGLETKIAE